MPVSNTEAPVLAHFLCVVSSRLSQGMPMQANQQKDGASRGVDSAEITPKQLPKGVVLGKDGKP